MTSKMFTDLLDKGERIGWLSAIITGDTVVFENFAVYLFRIICFFCGYVKISKYSLFEKNYEYYPLITKLP